MKSVLLLFLLFIPISIIAQVPVSQVEGFLEVFHPQDTTSTYVGKRAGQRAFTSFGTPAENSFFGEGAGEKKR